MISEDTGSHCFSPKHLGCDKCEKEEILVCHYCERPTNKDNSVLEGKHKLICCNECLKELQENEIEKRNEALYKMYMMGFQNELDGKTLTNISDFDNGLKSAYVLGCQDAIIGDDVRSVDYRTKEEIIESIKKHEINAWHGKK